ncbi:NADH-quinone oxidoreductase subunit NuoN [Francisellaceae bacterium]|nr:NADH-quinone oxidoreductase subunit NuoN [Francisellaceae bacterium]
MSSTSAITFSSLIPVLPEIFLLLMIIVIMMADITLAKIYRNITYILSQLTLVVLGVLGWLYFNEEKALAFHGQFYIDNLEILLKGFVYFITFLVFAYSRTYLKKRKMQDGEYYLLILCSVLGAMVLISSSSLLTMYIGLELMSLPIYALIAIRTFKTQNGEAAIKYFVMGAIASGILLYGMSFFYGITGHLDILQIANYLSTNGAGEYKTVMLISMVFMIVAICLKLGAAPFHMWIPDVYEGTPNAVLAYLGTVPKLAAFGFLVTVLTVMLPMYEPEWRQVLLVLAVISLLMGNLVALVQTNIKRMFGYSTVSHIGFVLLALAMGDNIGYAAGMYYIIVYAVMAAGGFGLILLLTREGFEADKIEDYAGLNRRNSWLAFMMLIVLFSMAGIPPFAGFTAKLMVLNTLMQNGHYILTVYALIISVIAAFYYLRVIKVMYFDNPIDTTLIPVNKVNYIAISVNCLIIFLFGVFPIYLTEAVNIIYPS